MRKRELFSQLDRVTGTGNRAQGGAGSLSSEQMSTPTCALASAAPEAAPDPRRGASWSGRATSASCQKEFHLQMPCREGRRQGGERGWSRGGSTAAGGEAPAQLQTQSEPRWGPYPRAERLPGSQVWGLWDGDNCTTCAAQRPVSPPRLPEGPPLPGHTGSAPPAPIWWYSHVNTPKSKLTAHVLSAEGRRCEKEERERETRRPDTDRHTKA